MKYGHVIFLLLLTISNSMDGQINCNFNIISEIETGETLFFVEEIFGNGEKKKYRNRIIKRTYTNGQLQLFIGVKSIEKGNFFCKALASKDTLMLQFSILAKENEPTETGYYTYREIAIEINGLQISPNTILLNEEEIIESDEKFLTFPASFEIIDRDTVNCTDKYGQRQGKWIEKISHNITESYYKDSQLISASVTEYYASGNIESVYFHKSNLKENEVYFRSYFESGEIKEENYRIINTGIFKKRWYPSGALFQENSYNGNKIEIKQFRKNGLIDCICETKVGVEFFHGKTFCWTTNEFNIPCTFFDNEGNEIEIKERLFKLSYEIRPR